MCTHGSLKSKQKEKTIRLSKNVSRKEIDLSLTGWDMAIDRWWYITPENRRERRLCDAGRPAPPPPVMEALPAASFPC